MMRTPTTMLLLCTLNLLACAPRHGRRGPTAPPEAPSAEELFQQGQARARAGDPLRAEQYLAEALRRGYPAEEALPPLLQVCISTSRLRLALRYAEPHLAGSPDNWPLRFLVATILHSLGDTERAYRELYRVLEAAPDQPEPHYAMARVMLDQDRDLGQVRHHLQRHLDLSPAGPGRARTRNLLWELDHRQVAAPRQDAGPPQTAAPTPDRETRATLVAPPRVPSEVPAPTVDGGPQSQSATGGVQ